MVEEVASSASFGISKIYQQFINSMPDYFGNFFGLLILVIVVFIYIIFIWKFYTFISKKNFLKLNSGEPKDANSKTIPKILYFLEYIILSPFVIFLEFIIFTTFLILLTQNIAIKTIFLISATIIAVIRLSSYYNEILAKDIAKLLPFTLLAIAITTPNFFNVERILTNLSQIPHSLDNVLIYLFFIFLLEATFRFFEFIFSLFGLEIVEEKKEEG